MTLLPSIIADPSGSRPHQPLILVQSSASQTCLPVLRNLAQPTKRPIQTLLVCFLYTPTSLIAGWPNTSSGSLKVLDYTAQVPGYDESRDPRDEVLTAARSGQSILDSRGRKVRGAHREVQPAPPGSLHVIIDSIDTLAADLASISQTYTFIKSLLGLITARSRALASAYLSRLHVTCTQPARSSHRAVRTDSASPSLSFAAGIDTDQPLCDSSSHHCPPSGSTDPPRVVVPHAPAPRRTS